MQFTQVQAPRGIADHIRSLAADQIKDGKRVWGGGGGGARGGKGNRGSHHDAFVRN